MFDDPMNDDIFLREVDVAEMLGCSRSKLRNDRCNVVGLPYFKVGRSVRYSRNETLKYLHGCRVDPQENKENCVDE